MIFRLVLLSSRPMEGGDSQHQPLLPLFVLMLIFSSSQAQSDTAFRWWGELGYNFRYQKFEDSDGLTEHIPILRLHGSSVLYRPWLPP